MARSHTEEHELPWVREGVLTKRLLHDGSVNGRARFHKYDLWHCYHLGVARQFLASGLLILQTKVPGRNVDERFDAISEAYSAFCRSHHIPRIIGKIDQHLCGSTLPEPKGGWNKAAVSSNLTLFLEDYCRNHPELVRGNERLELFAPCFYNLSSPSFLFPNEVMKFPRNISERKRD